MNADQLKKERAKMKKTQIEMANLLKANPRTYQSWEAGRHKIPDSIELIIKLLKNQK